MEFCKYIIIGNGIAGHSAALEIRKRDPEGCILIVTKEPHLTYYRLKLTELIANPIEDRDLFLMTEEKAAENRIQIKMGAGVAKIDKEKKSITLDDDSEWGYEKLLIATGAQPFIPPTKGQEKKNVLSIRTLDDVRELQNDFADAENVIVVGGGLLGLEAAWALLALGKTVDVVEFAPWLLPRQLDEVTSTKFTEQLVEAGLRIHTGTSVVEILGEDSVEGVVLSDDTKLKAQGVLFNIGVRPDIALAAEAGLETGRGILVDKGMHTNAPDIFAAGDCIEYNGMTFGLWTQSNAQGKIAGTNMTGGSAAYEHPKLFSNLKLGTIQVFSSGDVQNHDEVREYQSDTTTFKKFFFKEEKPVGGILYGDIKDMGKVNQILDGVLDFEEYKKTLAP